MGIVFLLNMRIFNGLKTNTKGKSLKVKPKILETSTLSLLGNNPSFMIDLKNLETIKRRMKNTYIYHDDIESTKDDS